jgi:hypothetical protein
MRSLRSAPVAFVAIMLAGAASAGEMMVLGASPGLAVHKGDIVDGAHELVVPAGGRVVLMDPAGRTVALDGPYRGAPGGKEVEGAGMLRRLSALVTPGARKGHDTVVGAVRDATVPPSRGPRDPWLVDVSANGDRCVRGGRVTLWRNDARASRTLVMRREPASDWVKSEWPAAQATLGWPKALASEDGAKYRVMLDGPLSTKFITLHIAPSAFDNDAARLVWLFESGCGVQADTLIEALAAGSREPPGSAPR